MPCNQIFPKNRRRNILNKSKSINGRRYVPWGSILALLVTWIGLFVFSYKLYIGMIDLENQSIGLFQFLVQYIRIVRRAIVITWIIMTILTLMMSLVGACATVHCDHCYRGNSPGCISSILGSRISCGLFWILSYIINLCWMLVLSMMVIMASMYFAFMPVCLPQSGMVNTYCLNFTILSDLIGGQTAENSVNLLLCGGAIDKFCRLTKAIVPWYWGAYLGCIVVILGLAQFNGTLAANFAHAKHAGRYVKIRDRTSHHIEWSKNWKIDSLNYYDLENRSNVKVKKKSIKFEDQNEGDKIGNLPNGTVKFESDGEIDQTDGKFDTESQNGSIIVSPKVLMREGKMVPPYVARRLSIASTPMPAHSLKCAQ